MYSKYIKDFIDMMISNFDEDGSVILPDVFSKIKSSDAVYELVSSNLAKKLKLYRQDTVVGHKRIIYAIDIADKTREPVRHYFIDFFMKYLGFERDNIIFVNRSNFFKNQAGVWSTKFSAEEPYGLENSMRRMFEDKQHGLGKQFLSIAICES
jgi:hypothetical protein